MKNWPGWVKFSVLVLIGLIAVVLLAAIPVAQVISIKWIDLDAFKALAASGGLVADARLYQFVLSAITLLLAVGAVLLYRERREIVEEKKKLEETCKNAIADYNNFKALTDPILKSLVEHQKSVSEAHEAIEEIQKTVIEIRKSKGEVIQATGEAQTGARKIYEIFSRIKEAKPPVPKEPDIKDTKKRAAWELTQEGVNLLKVKNYPEGEAKFRAALALDPDFAATYYNLGVVLWQKGETDEAIKVLREAVRLQPDAAEAHYNLACCYALQGKEEDALKSLAQAVDKGFDEWPLMEKDEDLKSLRDDSGFKELAEKVKAWWEEKQK
jgi:tetratricopeptide (TPR) repeat protein